MRLLGAATMGDLALLERTFLPPPPPLLLLAVVCAGPDFFYLIWGLGGPIDPYVRAGMARQLDGGRGRLAEAVEAVKDNGVGALHLAAAGNRLEVCEFLVEDVRVDVDAFDICGVSAHSN